MKFNYAKTKQTGFCHPERKHYAGEKCKECYEHSYRPAWELKNQDRRRQVRKVRWQANKLAVFSLLGGKCVDCGEPDAIVLQIDHINDDGSLDRAKYSTREFYYAILSGRRRTDDLALVCANCHVRRTFKRLDYGPDGRNTYT